MDIFIVLVAILIGAKIGGFVAEKLRQPAVIGELVAGFFMGPYAFGIITHTEFLKFLSDMGIVVLMFLVGLHIDLRKFEKFLERGSIIAILGVVLPMILGYFAGLSFGWSSAQSLLLGGILSATSVSITARVLERYGKLNTKYGMAILDASVIDDILGIVIITMLIALLAGSSSVNMYKTGLVLAGTIAFFAFVLLFGKKIIPPMLDLGRHLDFRVKEGLFSIILALVFLFSFISASIGLSLAMGAFLIGLLIPYTKIREIEHEVYAFGYGFVIPVFFAYIGSFFNPSALLNPSGIIIALIIFAVALIGKVAGCFAGAIFAGFGKRDSLKIGIGMFPRLEMATVMAELGKNAGIIPIPVFSIIITSIVLTVFFTPLFLRAFIRR